MILVCIISIVLSVMAFVISAGLINRRIKEGNVNEHMPQPSPVSKDMESVIFLLLSVTSAVLVAFFSYKSNLSFNVEMISTLLLIFFVTMAALFDYKTWMIPNYIPLLLFGSRAVVLIYDMYKKESLTGDVVDSAVGCLACLLITLLASLIKKGSLGGGDVKLLAAMGFSLRTIPACYVMLIGLIAAIAVRYLRHIYKEETHDFLPLGPYIYVGFVAYVIFLL